MTKERAQAEYAQHVAFVGNAVQLGVALNNPREVYLHRFNVGTAWFTHFMGVLQSVGYSGWIDWTYRWDNGLRGTGVTQRRVPVHCVSLHDVMHYDSAHAVVTAIALDRTMNHDNDGWAYSWQCIRSQTVAETMLTGSYITDWHAPIHGDVKRGWRLVMPLLNTDLCANRRHQLPTSVAQWQQQSAGYEPLQEQVG